MNKKIIPFIILFVIIAAFVTVWLLSKGHKQVVEKEFQLPVETIKPKFGTLEKVYRLTGYVESEAIVTILPKLSGALTALYVNVGDYVHQGQLIGTIDPAPYDLTVQQAQSAYEGAKSTFDRVTKLYEANATTQQNYDQAKAQYEAYKSQYELAKLQQGYTNIISPANGVVLIKHTTVGSLVAPSIPIVTIGDMQKLIIKGRIPESYYFYFQKNRGDIPVYIEVPSLNNQRFTCTIKTVAPYISPETKNFEVSCSIAKSAGELLPGMFVYLNFVLMKKTGVWYVPTDAIVNNHYVWFVDEKSGTAKRIDIGAPFMNDDFFEVLADYKDLKFIVDGQHFIREGQKVKIILERTE